MHIVEDLKLPAGFSGRVGMTIGNFEGLHRGHRSVIQTLVRTCGRQGLTPAALTFKQHPLSVLGSQPPEMLVAPMDKIRLLEAEGIQILTMLDFTASFAAMAPDEFIHLLKSAIGPELLCLGKDFRFGKENQGNIQLIERIGEKLSISLMAVDETLYGNKPISSTRIRKEAKSGNFELVRDMLGNCYFTYIAVVPGTHARAPEGPERRGADLFRKSVYPANAVRVRPFFANWALPRKGSFEGDLQNLTSGEFQKARLHIGGEGDLLLSCDEPAHEQKVYRFYFIKPCRMEL
jgi:riboflavin kinase/FMN adenylyltransferase